MPPPRPRFRPSPQQTPTTGFDYHPVRFSQFTPQKGNAAHNRTPGMKQVDFLSLEKSSELVFCYVVPEGRNRWAFLIPRHVS